MIEGASRSFVGEGAGFLYSIGPATTRTRTDLAIASLGPVTYRRAFAVMERLAAVWKPPYETGAAWSAAIDREDGRGAAGVAKSVVIELGKAQGRFELLCLAVLTGAKVQPQVALKTFVRLRETGLFDLGTLLSRSSECEAEILGVLEKEYRALTVKSQKAAAFVRNARLVAERYDGDLLAVYDPGGETDVEEAGNRTVEKLQFFSHINSRAYWFCREMRRFGLWPRIAPRSGHAIDYPVRLALWRLNLVGEGLEATEWLRPADCVEMAKALPDLLPFFYQGERRCKHPDGGRCRDGCQVSGFCHLPGRQAGRALDSDGEAAVSGAGR